MKSKQSSNHARVYHAPDYILMGLIFGLLGFGLLALSSASVVVGIDRFGDSYVFLKRQLIQGVLPGLMCGFVCYIVDYRFWKKWARFCLFGSLILLIAVLVSHLRVEAKGAQRWLDLGIFSFQPSEIAKLLFILYMASWLEKRKEYIRENWKMLWLFLMNLGVIAGLIFLQPDLGTAGVVVLIGFAMYIGIGAPWQHLAVIVAGCSAVLYTAVKMAPYRLNRVLVFLHPGTDPQGIGYQIKQALIGIGSGGIIGLGFGRSRQKYNFLPEVTGDSIFAVIAEELGFIVAFAVICAFTLLVFRGLKIARNTRDQYGYLVALGLTVWIGFQAIINIGAIVSILPLTGVPLPFISYGSTALVSNLMAMGILLNISRQTK